MDIKTIIFDLLGTVTSTSVNILLEVKGPLSEYNLTFYTVLENGLIVGNPMEKMFLTKVKS